MKWFKHDTDAHADAKLKKVKIKYGMEGYGLYWYCLELIAGSVELDNINFELEHDSEIIAHDTGIHYQRVQEMMAYMVNIGLFENDGGRITCMKLARRLDKSMTTNPVIKKLITDMRTESKEYEGYLYFILAEPSSPISEGASRIKIGRSKNPWQRLKELKDRDDCRAYDLSILATMWSSNCVELETELHRANKEKNIENEWFIDCLELRSVIEKITNKEIDSDLGLLRHVVVSADKTRTEQNRTEQKRGKGRFTPPTANEVREYCRERGNSVDPERFVSFYESKGWYVGKNKMKDWKAAVRTWEKGGEKSDSGSALANAK